MSLKPRPVNFPKAWSDLEDSVEKIISLKSLERTVWDDRFSDIYALCVAVPEPFCEQLYNNTKIFLEQHVDSLYAIVASTEKDDLLHIYYEKWQVYNKGATYIQNLFSYLNNQFIKKQKYSEADLSYGSLSIEQVRACMLEIGELALDIWKRKMLQPLEHVLVSLLLQAASQDRVASPSVNLSVVHGVIESLVEVEKYKVRSSLELYETMFEQKFLEATAEYYQQEANQILAECTCSQYMEKVLSRIKDEDIRSRKFLHPSSYDKVTKVCQNVMVADHLEFLHSAAKSMVQNEDTKDLTNTYTLLKPIKEGLVILVKEFENHVKKIGLTCVTNLKSDNIPMQFVENLLNIYTKYSEMVRVVFGNDQEFWGALDKACVSAINHKEDSKSCPKASEWLARYTDYLLKKSAKGLSESEIDEKLSNTIIIFRYVEDKDIFQKFYARMLAQRLIHGVSVSLDSEESMINKLKQACGFEFTSKLHRMFTDIGVSKSLTERFHGYLESSEQSMDIGFQILVLQVCAWPLSSQQHTTIFSVPVIFQPSVQLFEEFYSKSFNGRKLTWLYSFASADIKVSYLDRPYVITMSVYQTSILLHFNDQESVTAAYLHTSTQLATDILFRNIKSLVDCGLLISSTGPEITDITSVSLNPSYTNKRTKFKLIAPNIQRQVEKVETEHVNATLQQDRKYYLECTIVRIMKARKILKHNLLVHEVICQSRSRFVPEVPFIKKIIEQLIEKQYLQRTDNPEEYAYLA